MRSSRDRFCAVLVLLPSLVLVGIFVYGFIGQTLYVSTTDWGRGAQAALAVNPQLHPVGLANYRELFTGFLDLRFRQDLVNMFFFTLLFVGASLFLGLLFATLLDQQIWGEGLFRTIFLFPMSLSFVVTGTIWRWLLQPQGGVNALPTLVGLPPGRFLWLSERGQTLIFNYQTLWHYLSVGAAVVLLAGAAFYLARRRRWAAVALGVPGVVLALWAWSGRAAALHLLPFPETHGLSLALIGVVLAATWQMAGYTMALYLAGLRTIPDDLREAARVDGANRWQVYRHVELPLLLPITWSAVIILGHIALKIFDLVLALAGTDNAPTSVPAISMYLTTFRGNQFAKGASIAVVLLVTVSFLIIPYLVSSGKEAGGE
ncbi:MAG: carbohydrate ABC transporter permease [Betaproteobacteria bacterium]